MRGAENKKKYCTEIISTLTEIATRASIVMLNFLYGKGKINHLLFIPIIILAHLISSACFIKSAIYDRGKIANKLKQIESAVSTISENNKPSSCFSQNCLIAIMIALQIAYIIGTSIAPILNKQSKLDIASYMLLSIVSFMVGIVPTVIVRRFQKIEDEIIVDQIYEKVKSTAD